MPKIKKNASLLALGLLFTIGSQAALIDLPGSNYSYDPTTQLAWLDLRETKALSTVEIRSGIGNNWISQGWRYATGIEIDSMFRANLASAATASAVATFSVYGLPNDFYAPLQTDIAAIFTNLISVLGGGTIENFAPNVGLIGVFDRRVPCIGMCEAFGLAEVYVTDSGLGSADMAGATTSTVGSASIGHFLVKALDSPPPTPSPVPSPPSSALLFAGFTILALLRRNNPQA